MHNSGRFFNQSLHRDQSLPFPPSINSQFNQKDLGQVSVLKNKPFYSTCSCPPLPFLHVGSDARSSNSSIPITNSTDPSNPQQPDSSTSTLQPTPQAKPNHETQRPASVANFNSIHNSSTLSPNQQTTVLQNQCPPQKNSLFEGNREGTYTAGIRSVVGERVQSNQLLSSVETTNVSTPSESSPLSNHHTETENVTPPLFLPTPPTTPSKCPSLSSVNTVAALPQLLSVNQTPERVLSQVPFSDKGTHPPSTVIASSSTSSTTDRLNSRACTTGSKEQRTSVSQRRVWR